MPELSGLNHSFLDSWLEANTDAGRWCVAYSGGPDSTVLLHLMHQWCTEHPDKAPDLVAIHVNHGMQAEADSWQAHCEAQCNALGVSFIVSRAVVESAGQGAEAAARAARYTVFESEIRADDVLFMGHHLDDQVETYFLRLLRGSGLSGLSAMPEQRSLGGGKLIRPLLAFTREQLQYYLVSQNLSAIDDPSNLDTSIDRNYLRQQVLPLLGERWSAYRTTVARAAQHASISQSVIDECLPVPGTIFSVLDDPGLEYSGLASVSVDAAMIKLRGWLRARGCAMPDQQLLHEFVRQLREAGPGASPRMNCSSYVLQRYQNRVYLLPEFSRDGDFFQSPVALVPGAPSDINGVGRLSLEPVSDIGLCLSDGDELQMRWRQGGERCRPRGRPYNQRLKKLLQEFAVPPWWRERVPLLYLGDELLAVGGLWLCESSRLSLGSSSDGPLWQLRWERKPSLFN